MRHMEPALRVGAVVTAKPKRPAFLGSVTYLRCGAYLPKARRQYLGHIAIIYESMLVTQ